MKQLESKKCKFTKIIGTISQPFLLLCRLREFFSPLVLHPSGYSKTYYKIVQNGFTPQFCFWKNGRTFLLFLLTCDAPHMVPNMTFPLCFAEGQEVPLHRRGDPIHCCSSVAKPCLTLCVPMCYRLPGSSVHGILQERILEWAAISSSRGIFPTQVSCLPGRFFTTEPPGKPLSTQSYPLLLALFQDLDGKWQASLVLISGPVLAAHFSPLPTHSKYKGPEVGSYSASGQTQDVTYLVICARTSTKLSLHLMPFLSSPWPSVAAPAFHHQFFSWSLCMQLPPLRISFSNCQLFCFPGGSDGKESACSAGHLALIPGSGKSPGEGNGYPLQYSCLENSMGRGAWWTTVHEVPKSWTWLST